MKDLIKSLEILQKYLPFKPCGNDPSKCYNQEYPTHCEHDVLLVPSINAEVWAHVSDEDMKALDELGWDFLEEYGCIGSFRFGSN